MDDYHTTRCVASSVSVPQEIRNIWTLSPLILAIFEYLFHVPASLGHTDSLVGMAEWVYDTTGLCQK